MIKELKADHRLRHLLAAAELPRSVYYYQCKAQMHPCPDAELKADIERIFHRHKGRYGYRRITGELRNSGMLINHKKVQRLMSELGLKSTFRPKRYNSYKGQSGKVAPDLLNRNFNAPRPNQKWVTDVTEFKVGEVKVYLSPIIDLFNQEVVSYEVRKNVRLSLVTDMLSTAIKSLSWHEKPIFHSDQGWQYQNPVVQRMIQEHGLSQSMSRKGNCLDNAVAENFFGILKSEMYHGETFKDADALIDSIKEYIEYYNKIRIKLRLGGLSPIDYRNQTCIAA